MATMQAAVDRQLIVFPAAVFSCQLGGLGVAAVLLLAGADQNCSTSWLRRLAAISQYFSSISMPMARRPRFLLAISVVRRVGQHQIGTWQ
jgi:hypothetical protein